MIAARLACMVIATAACRTGAPAVRAITPAPGLVISVYQDGDAGYGVVEERRWVEISGPTLVLEHIDARAPLASLVLEPLGGSGLVIGACARDLASAAGGGGDPTPVASAVRCQVRGRGRHLLRVVHVTPALAYRVQHDVTMTARDQATLSTRFAIPTPRWGTRAEVRLFAGRPGGGHAPEPLARESITLDGSIAVLAAPARQVAARLRWIYDGVVRGAPAAEDVPTHAVWVWLELEAAGLVPGALHARIAVPEEPARDVVVPAAGWRERAGRARAPLWIDAALHGLRRRQVVDADGASLADRIVVSVGNTGAVPREVWVEERLRRARQREVVHGWPTRPSLTGELARARLVVPPGATARTGFEIAYVL